VNARVAYAPGLWVALPGLIAVLLGACAQAPADRALQACRDLVAQKSGAPIHIERKTMQIAALEAGSNTVQVSGPLRFVSPDGSAHIETLDCRVRLADGTADVIHLQLSWSMQELERSVRETR